MLNDVDKLKALADHTIQRHFPYIATSENPYLAFLKEVVKGQASLMSTRISISLIKDLLELMEKHEADYTNTFLALTFDNYQDMDMFKNPEFIQWRKDWQARLGQKESKEDSHQLMRRIIRQLSP